jgi:autotransporter-associated beta strand protein
MLGLSFFLPLTVLGVNMDNVTSRPRLLSGPADKADIKARLQVFPYATANPMTAYLYGTEADKQAATTAFVGSWFSDYTSEMGRRLMEDQYEFDIVKAMGYLTPAQEQTFLDRSVYFITNKFKAFPEAKPGQGNLWLENVTAMGLTALNFPTHPQAQTWIDAAVRWTQQETDFYFRDGAGLESPRYHEWTLTLLSKFFVAADRCTDATNLWDRAKLKASLEWYLRYSSPRLRVGTAPYTVPAWGDSNYEDTYGMLAVCAPFYMGHDPDFAYRLMGWWRKTGSVQMGGWDFNTTHPQMVDPRLSDSPAAPFRSTYNQELGQVVMRGETGGTNEFFATFNCGSAGITHANADNGHLDLFAFGVPVALDSMAGPYDDSNATWNRQTMAHNTVRAVPPPESTTLRWTSGAFQAFGASAIADYAVGDTAYGTVSDRHVVMVKGDYMVVWDQISASTYSEWFFHTPALTLEWQDHKVISHTPWAVDLDIHFLLPSGALPAPTVASTNISTDYTTRNAMASEAPVPSTAKLYTGMGDGRFGEWGNPNDSNTGRDPFKLKWQKYLFVRSPTATGDYLTVLHPRKVGETPELTATLLSSSDTSVSLSVNYNGRTDTITINTSGATVTKGTETVQFSRSYPNSGDTASARFVHGDDVLTTLNNALTATSMVDIAIGTVLLDKNNIIPNNTPVIIGPSGTLDISTHTDTVGKLIMDGGSVMGSGTLTASSIEWYGGKITANIASAGSFVKKGGAPWTPASNIAYSGDTVIEHGTLLFKPGQTNLSGTGTIILSSGTALDLNGTSRSMAITQLVAPAGSTVATGTGSLLLTGSGTLSSALSGNVSNVGSGTVALAGPFLSAVNLSVGGGATLVVSNQIAASVNVASTGSLVCNGLFTITNLSSIAGTLTGPGGFGIGGAGQLDIPAGVTLTVPYLVIDGQVQVAGTYSAARDAVHFSGSGTLVVVGGVPQAPTALMRVSYSDTAVSLAWQDNSAIESGYMLERSATSNGVWSVLVRLPADTTNRTDALLAGQVFYYRVSATNAFGASAASNVLLTGLPCVAPTNLAIRIDNTALQLVWPPIMGAVSYKVFRSTTSGGGYAVVGTPGASLFTDASLVNGTTYYYVVKALNACGDESPSSMEISTAPMPTQSGVWTSTSAGMWSEGGNWQSSLVPNGPGRTATFGQATAVTVTQNLVGSVMGHFTFSTSGYSLRGNPMWLDGAGAESILSVATGAATLSVPLDGEAGIRKTGAGTLRLTATNHYAGITRIEAGVLEVYSIGNFDNAGSNLGTASATNLSNAASTSSGNSLNSLQLLTNSDKTLRYLGPGESSDRAIYLNYQINNNGSIEANGTGPLILSGVISAYLANSSSGNLYFTLKGTSTADNALTGAFVDSLKGSGQNSNLRKQGTGTWLLSGNRNYRGVTLIDSGLLKVESIANAGASCSMGLADKLYLSTTATPYAIIFGGGTLVYVGASSASSNRKIGLSANGTLSASAGTLTLSGEIAASSSGTKVLTLTGTTAGNVIQAPILDGSGNLALTKEGSGSWALTNMNTYTGETLVNGGTLILAASGTLANSSRLTLNSGSCLDVSEKAAGYVWANAFVAGGSTTPSVRMATGQAFGIGGSVTLNYNQVPALRAQDGTIAIADGTVISVNNQGVALSQGDYTLIQNVSGNHSSWTLSSITGNGTESGLLKALVVVGSDLVLRITAAPPSSNLLDLPTYASSTNNIRTDGILKYAYTANGTTRDVNGVTFAQVNGNQTVWASGTVTNVFLAMASGSAASRGEPSSSKVPDAAYRGLLSGFVYDTAAPCLMAVTLTNLLAGRRYLVQAWVNDSTVNAVTRETKFAVTNGTEHFDFTLDHSDTGAAGGVGQFATFQTIAQGPSITLYLTAAGVAQTMAAISALQVRDISADFVWRNASGDGKWNTATNWQGGVAPSQLTDAAIFPDDVTGRTVILESSVSVKRLTFTGSYVLTGQSITFPSTVTNSVASGMTVSISNAVLGAGTGFVKTGTGLLSLVGNKGFAGKLDVQEGMAEIKETTAMTLTARDYAIAENATLRFSCAPKGSSGTLIPGTKSITGDGTFEVASGYLRIQSSSAKVSVSMGAKGQILIRNDAAMNNAYAGGDRYASNKAKLIVEATGFYGLNADAVRMGSLQGEGEVKADYDSRTLTLTGDSSGVFAGRLTEISSAKQLSLTKSGSSLQVLSGTNLYTGVTTISRNGGALQIDEATALAPGSRIDILKQGNETGALLLNTPEGSSNKFDNVFGGMYCGTSPVNNASLVPHIVNIQGANVLTKDLYIAGVGGQGLVFSCTNGALILTGGMCNNQSDGRPHYFVGPGEIVVSGVLSNGTGQAALTKLDSGIVTVHSVCSYTGSTFINGGVFALGANGDIGSTSGLTLAYGVTFDVSAKPSGYSWSRPLTLSRMITVRIAPSQRFTLDTDVTLPYNGNKVLIAQAGTVAFGNGRSVTVNNELAALTVGDYVLIEGFSGNLPALSAVTGNGVAVGCSASLTVVDNNLILRIKQDSITACAVSSTNILYGEALSFDVSVTQGASGTVAIRQGSVNGATVATVILVNSEGTTLYVPPSSGTNIYYAVYAGDQLYSPSASSGLQVLVNRRPVTLVDGRLHADKLYDRSVAAPVVTFEVSPSSFVVGETLTLSATASAYPASAAGTYSLNLGWNLSGSTANDYDLEQLPATIVSTIFGTTTWVGPETEGVWTTATNWTNNWLPSMDITAYFPATTAVNLPVNATVSNLFAAGHLTLGTGGKYLTVAGNIHVAGDLVLEATTVLATNGTSFVANTLQVGDACRLLLGKNMTVNQVTATVGNNGGTSGGSALGAYAGGLQAGVSSTVVWDGDIHLRPGAEARIGANSNAHLRVNGVISGATDFCARGLYPDSLITLAGENVWTGATLLFYTVRLEGGPDRLPPATTLAFGTSGIWAVLDLNGRDQQVAAITNKNTLAGVGYITNSSPQTATFTVGRSDSPTTNHRIDGNVNLVKKTDGLFRLNTENTYSGITRIERGTLELMALGAIDQSETIAVLTNAVLCTTNKAGYSVSHRLVASGGTVNVGAGKTLSFVPGTVLEVPVHEGLRTESGLSVTGDVNVNGATLQLTNAAHILKGQTYCLLTATGVISGSFIALENVPPGCAIKVSPHTVKIVPVGTIISFSY